MQRFNVDELKPHPKNDYFFDDITGDKWKEFLESIKNIGVIEPVIITQNKVIVSGHQRVRACKELGINEVWCDIRSYDNEDSVLQALIETNIRQRGDVGGAVKKIARRIIELERIRGIEHGGNHGNQYVAVPNNSDLPKYTQEDLARDLGMSVDTLNNYKKLYEMIPELEDLVDTGIVTKTTALAIMRELSEEEQVELISSMDTTKKITKVQVDKYLSELKDLRQEKERLTKDVENAKRELKNRPNIEVEVIPKDYRKLQDDVKNYKNDYNNLQKSFKSKVEELQELRKQIEKQKNQEPSEEYKKKLQNSVLIFCAKVSKFIEEVGGYVWLSEQINEIPELEKAGYIRAVNAVKSWADTMDYNLNGGK